ncbi:hypothetical protein D5F01_LYC22323 [Larimichthys crocea]|uniref:Uncharacterized protein n=1 Tax=Larimichthys crocea TaxID=215358 RepID=A0A6G0HMC2_LARCR|nr:hypothetical protein D5F01_LYC22323 [Larimichthys crocea]
MPATPCEDEVLLMKANKKIAYLKDDIRRLSDELLKKDSLLSSFMDVALQQSKKLASLSTTLHDTVVWDPATCPRPSSCSTPNHQSSWADVVARNHKRDSNKAVSPPRLSLSNRYAALSDDTPAHPPDAPAGPAAPSPSDLDPQSAPADTTTFPPLVAGSARMAGHKAEWIALNLLFDLLFPAQDPEGGCALTLGRSTLPCACLIYVKDNIKCLVGGRTGMTQAESPQEAGSRAGLSGTGEDNRSGSQGLES